MVLVIEDKNGNRTVYESNSPYVVIQMNSVSVQMQGQETDSLTEVAQAAHTQFKWLQDLQQQMVFAEYR